MSRLFPGQIKADSIKKKLSLTPQTSPRSSSDFSKNSQQQKVSSKPSDISNFKPSDFLKKPVDSQRNDIKKSLNFDDSQMGINILEQIMSNMSNSVKKD